MVTSATYVGLATLAMLFCLMHRITAINLDWQEPPLLKPRVPWIGHIIGLLKHEATYFSILRTRTTKPIITVPMLSQKKYIIFSPYLARQAMRHRNLDFDVVGLGLAQSVAAISHQAMAERVKKGPNTYMAESVAAIRSSLMGQGLCRLNAALLSHVQSQLNAVGAGDHGLRVPSMWLWMRDMMSMATAEAFYGSANPYRADPASLDAFWDLGDAIPAMMFMPPAMARAGARHRDRIVRTLRPYFDARLDQNEDASAFVASRTEASVRHNIVGDDLCKFEIINFWLATVSSIPALLWTLRNVCLRPGLVEKLRSEILPLAGFAAKDGQRSATLDIRLVEKQCPLLLNCQREGMRMANHLVARRAITADTLLTDEDGATYLLKQGSDVMWSAKVPHEMSEAWGADALALDPERFVKEAGKDMEKKRRAAYMPFGGGAHLCPGRNFASVQILGLMSALLLGYEMEGFRAEDVKMGSRTLASAIPKPAADGDGGPVTLRRRKGWEDVQWSLSWGDSAAK